MSFEQYQFQRYYLPGSLFLMYFTLLLAPFVNWSELRTFVGGDFLPLVTLVTAAFVASPAVGYLLYCLYDPRSYNRRFMDWRRRRSLRLLLEWASECEPRLDNELLLIIRETPFTDLKKRLEQKICLQQLRPSLKSTIDSLIHSRLSRQPVQITGAAAGNLRGYWGHFAARFVCGLIVPAIATFLLCGFLLLVVFAPNLLVPEQGGLFLTSDFVSTSSWLLLVIQLSIIWSISIWIFAHRGYPKNEAFELEYDMISSIITRQGAASQDEEKWNNRLEHIPLRRNLNQRIREAFMRQTPIREYERKEEKERRRWKRIQGIRVLRSEDDALQQRR